MPEHTPAPSPGRSYYGFVLFLLGWSGIVTYLLWALVPHEYLAEYGWTYLPHRYWAMALPSLIITGLLLFVFCIYPAINFTLVVPPNDGGTIYDTKAVRLEEYPSGDGYSVPPVYDIPITQVCQLLYRNTDANRS